MGKIKENPNMFTIIQSDIPDHEITFLKDFDISNEDMIEILNEYLEELGFLFKVEITSEDHDQG
jgi:hypothetical protein